MPHRALIVLQENSGRVSLPDGVSGPVRDTIFAMVDQLAENFEDIKTTLQASGRYDVVYLLTDNACTRDQLLGKLMLGNTQNLEFDLIILGHGNEQELALKSGPNLTTGVNGNIRSLITEARTHGYNSTSFNLSMVYMCNCYGSCSNDDWLSIGAKVSIGSDKNDWMPEPMTTFFIQNWLNHRTASDAAQDAYNRTVPFYKPIFPDKPQPCFVDKKVPDPLHPGKTKTVKVPGTVMITDQRILDSRLVVGGLGTVRKP